MTLEQQVCSLELAKRLKELGVEQRSLLYWWCLKSKWSISYSRPHPKTSFRDEPWYSAFTVAELGEMLPVEYHSYRVGQIWFCVAFEGVHMKLVKSADTGTEADARAKMLIYLKENNLI